MLKKNFCLIFLFMINSASFASTTFSSINGSNGDLDSRLANEMGVSIVRVDVSWSQIEKVKGVYDWHIYDKRIKNIKNKGLQVLPVLAYTPEWNRVYPGKTGSPPRDYLLWDNFVNAAVARYSSAPYNIKYFQIWNEPTKKAKYWLAPTKEFIEKIYIPAAKIVRLNKGLVVFGGWPASNSLTELDYAMFGLGAIQYTDIIDFHYGNEGPYEHLYSKYLKPGLVKGIWQTELGYRTGTNELLRIYLTIFHWMLIHNWIANDQYKLFWYPGWASTGKEPRGLTISLNSKEMILTSNGEQLKLLNSLYEGGTLKLLNLTSFSTINDKEKLIFAVSVGRKKIIIANVFPRKQKNISNSIDYNLKLPYKPSSVYTITPDAIMHKLDYEYSSGYLTFSYNTQKNNSGFSNIFFFCILQ
ncbi:beta-galactosidase [Raoultella planticola]|uniref:beta-galactosidase n=1 Tax=Raoultella planticola TaxID=575 RepID=UPI00388F0722